MSRGISVSQWIITRVSISVPPLYALSWRDYCIRLCEAPQSRIIPAGVVEHEPEISRITVLSCISIFRGRCARGVARLAPGFIAQFGNDSTSRAGCEACASQVVTNEEVQCSIGSHRDSLCTSVIILRHHSIRNFIVRTHEVGRGCAVEGALDALAIAIIDKCRA